MSKVIAEVILRETFLCAWSSSIRGGIAAQDWKISFGVDVIKLRRLSTEAKGDLRP